MKKLSALSLMLSVCLLAADFWTSKPYTEWNDKEIKRMIADSPWSRQVSITLSGRSGGGGRTKGGPSANTDGSTMGGNSGPVGGSVGGMGAGGGRSKSGSMADDTGVAGAPSVNVTLRWQTALPVRQALVMNKFGSEASTSPDAKKILGEEQKLYIIAMSGFPGMGMAGTMERLKEELLKQTTLNAKGKDPIAATDVQIANGAAVFVFPRTNPFTLDDKEVEFSTHVGSTAIKYKFHLKDMVYNGKLEL